MTRPSSDISLTWLLRLRWITVAAQTAAILVSLRLLPGELSPLPLLGLVALGALSNLFLQLRLRQPGAVHPSLPGLVLGLDILLLTGLLYLSGGPANPFTAIYLVHVTLAAVVMRGVWAWALGALAIAGFGLLFFWNVHVHSLAHMNHDEGGISLHLVGMWVAFAITAGLIAAFVGRVTEALRQRDEELAALRDLSARQARLAALTTLAAGVAHELGTPLGTIAIAAKELQRAAEALGLVDGDIPQDAALIRSEVDRCRRILDQLADPSGTSLGEDFRDLAWSELEADLLEGVAPEDRLRLAFDWPPEACGAMPRRGLARALRAVVANAPGGHGAARAGARLRPPRARALAGGGARPGLRHERRGAGAGGRALRQHQAHGLRHGPGAVPGPHLRGAARRRTAGGVGRRQRHHRAAGLAPCLRPSPPCC